MLKNDKTEVYRNTRTIIGNENQVIRSLGLPFNVRPNSTLNQHLEIEATRTPAGTTPRSISYFILGAGGMSALNCTPSSATLPPVFRFYQHSPRSTNVFNIMPIVMRETAQDLTPAERAKYRLRRLVAKDGVNYYAYYAKAIDKTKIRLETKIFTAQSDGTWTDSDYVATTADAKPTPQDYTPDEEQLLMASYSKVTALVPISIDAEDVREIKNVFNILYGDPDRAITTEMALVSGVDIDIKVNTPRGEETVREAIAAQVEHINTVMVPYGVFNQGFDRTFDLGITEPMAIFQTK